MNKKQRFEGLSGIVKEIIRLLEKEGMIAILRQCPNMNSRYIKMEEIIPGLPNLETMLAKQLLFYLQNEYKMDFGVCSYCEIEGCRQYCTRSGKIPCGCAIPQSNFICSIRDKGVIFIEVPSIGKAD